MREQLPDAVRARRRAVRGAPRRGRRGPAGVRGPPGADPPGRVAGRPARREDAGRVRRLRPARARRRVVRRPAVRASAGPRWRRRWPASTGPCYLTRTTTDPAEAEEWFTEFEGAGLDGVVAKPLDATYQQNARTMLKIKHERTADVVRGRLPRAQDLHPRAAAARQPAARPVRRRRAAARRRQRQLHREAPGRADRGAPAAGRARSRSTRGALAGREWAIANPDRVPGTQSRWSAGKDLSFTPLRPDRVLEVEYDHMEGRRFRHTAQFKRWRDRPRPRHPAATSSSRSRSATTSLRF